MLRSPIKWPVALSAVAAAMAAFIPLGLCAEAPAPTTQAIAPAPNTRPVGFSIHGRVTAPAGWEIQRPDLSRVVVYLASDPALDGPPPIERASVAQHNKAFAPNFIAVALGTDVEFPNWDHFDHNVFSRSKAAPAFDLDRYPYGQSKTRTFDKTGVVQVFCNIHPGMRAMIFVTPNRFFTRPDGNGGFAIDGVPAGNYQLVAWHERCEEVRRVVTFGPIRQTQGETDVSSDVLLTLEENRKTILANDPPERRGGYGVERGLGVKRERLGLPVVKESHPAPTSGPSASGH
jgi:plastocyanin